MTYPDKMTRPACRALPPALLASILLLPLAAFAARAQEFAAPPRPGPCLFFPGRPCPQPEPQVEPGAGGWRTWVLSSGGQFRLAPPPVPAATSEEIGALLGLASQRDAAALDSINYWDAGSPSLRWNEFAVERVIRSNFIGPRAARVMAHLNVALYDATVAAWDSKYFHRRQRPSRFSPALTTALPNPQSPSYPSEHAVAAGAGAAVLAYFFPADAEFFRAKAEEAGRSRLLAGVEYPSDVAAGLELGRAVAALVIERARTDGSDAVFSGTIPQGSCNWKGTTPFEPTAGTWRTWVLTSSSQLRPAAPPACDSEQMARELAEVKNFARPIPTTAPTFNTTRLAFYWQGAIAPIKPFSDLTSQKISEYRLDQNPPRAARAYALVSLAFYDALIACFDAKYTYWAIRPNQLDPTLTTLFPNPSHPTYPSAHSALSGSQAAVLAYLFPRDAAFFTRLADESADARLWAGIHFRADLDVGLAQAREVARLLIERARNDGSQ